MFRSRLGGTADIPAFSDLPVAGRRVVITVSVHGSRCIRRGAGLRSLTSGPDAALRKVVLAFSIRCHRLAT